MHYYPQSEVFNDDTDAETNARRLRSTRSLWDPTYIDESWIDEPIRFIPRMQEMIEESYPGTPLLISEWNFGADTTMNGALAIAEVLGIYGREGVDAAAYWRNPDVGQPGLLRVQDARQLRRAGSRFGGDVVAAESSDVGTGERLRRRRRGGRRGAADADQQGPVRTAARRHLRDRPAPSARRFTYGPEAPEAIAAGTADLTAPLELPASSITVVEVPLVS